jgi:hypothetical protein
LCHWQLAASVLGKLPYLKQNVITSADPLPFGYVYDFFSYAAIGFVGEGKCFFDGIKKAFTLP